VYARVECMDALTTSSDRCKSHTVTVVTCVVDRSVTQASRVE
jgi:hypothetical protein